MNRNRLKLLILKDSVPLGGAESLLLVHLEYLDRTKYVVHLVTQTDIGKLLPIAQEKADYYECLKRKIGLDIKSIIKLRKYLRDNNIDIVHTHDWISSLYVFLSSKGLKLKKVSTVHAYDYSWRNIINLQVLKYFYKIICVSKSQRLNLFNMGLPWKKLAVVYNCYDDNKFYKISRPSLSEKQIPFRIVMTGMYRWQKDQKTLINALHILKNRGLDVELHLVGGPAWSKRNSGLYEECKILVNNLNLNSTVCFHVDKIVDGDFLSQFDLFVFSSKSECFPIAPLESIACGLPVLVSDIPPLMEIIDYGKFGLYFETGNAESCAKEIIKVMDNSTLLQSLSEKSYERAKEFRPKKVVNILEQLYQNLMQSYVKKERVLLK
tara:strand:- start:1257 stop:2393 length:1137 start_codon:yes stop_codon:yes gene_type:complete